MRSVNSRTICILTLTAICVFSVVAGGQPNPAIPKYDGTWVLNRAKSSGLTGALGNAEVRLIVTQSSKELTVEQKIVGRSHEQSSPELIYKLDGSQTETEVVRPLAGTSKQKARWVASSKTLELSSTISGEIDGKPISVTTREYWQLSATGKALKVTRVRQSPQGTQTFRLLFDKQ